MKTKIIHLEKSQIGSELDLPAKVLAEGGTVAFPTETVYGLGANALDEVAVSKIYHAKGRPSDNPLIVHIATWEMVDALVAYKQPYVERLMETLWPGPIAFVMQKNEKLPANVTGGLDTVALRMPNHPIALELIKRAGVPIAAPSANLSGKPSPTIGRYVVEDLDGRVDVIIDGGEVAVGIESTVLDVTGPVPIILRPGKITREIIESLVGVCGLDPGIESSDLAPKSPGMKYKHYAPNAEVVVYTGDHMRILAAFEKEMNQLNQEGKKVGIMLFDEDLVVLEKLIPKENDRVVFFTQGSQKQLDHFANNLFRDLRRADELGCHVILIKGVAEKDMGHAIMNRIIKAAEGRVIKI